MQIILILKKRLGFILFITFLIAGILVYKDYGVSWDEPNQHEIGTVSYDYIFSGSNKLIDYPQRDYGVAFELPLIIIEKTLGLTDTRSIFLARHLITHIFFLLSAMACFLLIDFLYKNKVLATIGFLLFVLNPLLYAHSFINSKDIPFMGMFMICFYLNALSISTRKPKHFILLGIAAGLLINMRIIGIMLVMWIAFFLVYDFYKDKKNGIDNKKNIRLMLILIGATSLTLYISWPYLWMSPIWNFILTIKHMSKFSWYDNVVFNGKLIPSTEIGWTYLPVWFGITTPIFYLIFGIWGIFLIISGFLRKPLQFLNDPFKRNYLFYLTCFISPVLLAIMIKSILYDSWRHMFFIYPSFVLMTVYGLHYIKGTRAKNITLTGSLIVFSFLGYFIIYNHPFQHLYFNRLVDTKTPEHLRSQFELDYWGCSYKQSLEYILDHDNSPVIYVAVANEPGLYNMGILKHGNRERIHIIANTPGDYFTLLFSAADKRRIHLQENIKVDYYITNYRWHPQDYAELKGKEWHSIKVLNNSITTIFKLKKTDLSN